MFLESTPSLPSYTFIAGGWDDYALVDSGYGRKLERFKHYHIDRPEPQAMWEPRLSQNQWEQADAVFTGAEDDGHWRFLKGERLDPWLVSYQQVTLQGKLTAFRHLGYFPEQQPHWNVVETFLKSCPHPSVLNLFAYTGMASLIAAAKGATVTHVDASEKAIAWAIENQRLSNLENKSIRWICEDASRFAAREVRRGKKYHLILLDPPKFGRGPSKEIWELFQHLPTLLHYCASLLEENGLLILNTYALRLSHTALTALLTDIFHGVPCEIMGGELAIQEENQGRVIPQSMFAMVYKQSP